MAELNLKDLTEINNSPQFEETAAGWSCTRQFVTGGDRLDKAHYYNKLFPLIGAKIKTPRNTEIELNSIDIVNKSNRHLLITMQYGGDPRINGKPEFTIEDGTLEKPIEQHKAYKANWNHALWTADGTTNSPSWWETAKNTEMSPTDAKKWKWAKEDYPVETGWTKTSAATKPHTETYLVPAPVIRETTYYRKLPVLIEKGVLETGVIKTPNTPLVAKIGGEYLINSMSLRFDGKWWELNRSFQFADVWDSELYPKKEV